MGHKNDEQYMLKHLSNQSYIRSLHTCTIKVHGMGKNPTEMVNRYAQTQYPLSNNGLANFTIFSSLSVSEKASRHRKILQSINTESSDTRK